MKWEPKRKRAVEDGGNNGWDTARASALGVGATAVAGNALRSTALARWLFKAAPSVAPKLGAFSRYAAPVLKWAGPVFAAAGAANLGIDRYQGARRAEAYRDKVLRGEDTTFWEDISTPADLNFKYQARAEDKADLAYYQTVNAALKDPGMSSRERNDAIEKAERQRDEAKRAARSPGLLGRAENFASAVFTGGFAKEVFDNEEDRKRLHDLEDARKEYGRLLKYGVFERASDDDSRGRIFMDMARKRAADLARLSALANGAALESGDERFNPPKTKTGAADWAAERDRVSGMSQRLEKEFRENYATAYDALMSSRRRDIFEKAIVKGLEGVGYKGVTLDTLAQDPRLREDYDRLMGLSLMDLDETAQFYNAQQAEKSTKSPSDNTMDLMTGR